MLERAAVEEDPIERQRMLTFVVVGGGLAGTEIGSLTHELVHDSLQFFPSIQPTEIRFVIASRAERVMPEMTDKITRSSLRLLARRGLDLRTGVSVAAATPYKVTLSTGEEIPTRTIIATTGVRAHPLVQTLPVATDEMGRVICERTCQVPGYPGVYAAGDNAAVPDASGTYYPPMGLIAFAQGKWAGLNVLAEHRGKRIRPMTYTAMDGIRLTKGYAAVQIKLGRRPVMQITGWAGSLFWYVGALLNIETWGRRWQLITDWLVTGFLPRDTTSMLIAQHRAVLPMRFEDGEIILRSRRPEVVVTLLPRDP